MSRARRWTIGIALLVVFVFPREAKANFFDFIWEMSGPRMIGATVLQCKVDIRDRSRECRVFDWKVAGNIRPFSDRTIWLALDGTVYTSTGSNSGGHHYNAFETWMAALEPMIEGRSGAYKKVAFYHGAGATIDGLAGQDFRRFANYGVKLRPVGLVINGKWDAAFNLRWYPDGFTTSDFGLAAVVAGANPPREVSWGLSFGRSW